MKPRLLITKILVLFFSVTVVGCADKEDKPNEQSVFAGVKDLSHTNCKTVTRSSVRKEYLELSEEDKYLVIKHINAVFNCCPKELLVTSKISNDTIFINETEKESLCDCICPYDLNYKIGALNYSKYHVILGQKPSNTILIEFDVNFKLGMSETINVKHKLQ